MNTLKKLEEYLKSGGELPEIRYFNGIDKFCTPCGKFKGATLEESYKIFLNEVKNIKINNTQLI